MYAIIQSGGKQYKVAEGDVVSLEKLPGEVGEKVEFDRVLMVANGEDISVGKPFIDGAKVSAELAEHGRGKKVKIIKFRRRKHSMKQQGHRQYFTKVKITGISKG